MHLLTFSTFLYNIGSRLFSLYKLHAPKKVYVLN